MEKAKTTHNKEETMEDILKLPFSAIPSRVYLKKLPNISASEQALVRQQENLPLTISHTHLKRKLLGIRSEI